MKFHNHPHTKMGWVHEHRNLGNFCEISQQSGEFWESGEFPRFRGTFCTFFEESYNMGNFLGNNWKNQSLNLSFRRNPTIWGIPFKRFFLSSVLQSLLDKGPHQYNIKLCKKSYNLGKWIYQFLIQQYGEESYLDYSSPYCWIFLKNPANSPDCRFSMDILLKFYSF